MYNGQTERAQHYSCVLARQEAKNWSVDLASCPATAYSSLPVSVCASLCTSGLMGAVVFFFVVLAHDEN